MQMVTCTLRFSASASAAAAIVLIAARFRYFFEGKSAAAATIRKLSSRRISRAIPPLSLNSRGATFGEGPHLLHGRHGGVAGESREQCAVRPSELHRLLGRFAGEQAI